MTLYKTGELAPKSGNYDWVKYTDGTTRPLPTEEEQHIYLKRNSPFPPINSQNKGAYWRSR